MILLATSFGDGDVLLWMFEFFLFVIWFWLLLTIFGTCSATTRCPAASRRSGSSSSCSCPYVGILMYLIARGHGMAERAAKAAGAAAGADERTDPSGRRDLGRRLRRTRSRRPSRCSTPELSTRRSSTS